MAQQIMFLEKNLADQATPGIVAAASNGTEFAANALNRSRIQPWITTGSDDTATETWTVTWTEAQAFTRLILNKHNFKSFTVKYWNGSAWTDFSAPISETSNSKTTNQYTFTEVSTTSVQISATTTQSPNDDKYLYQFVATNLIGQFQGWPMINKPTVNRNRIRRQMLSGKSMVTQNVGGFSCTLNVQELRLSSDLDIVEKLVNATQGFLLWLCGGDEAQFSSPRFGYRLEDLFLVQIVNEYQPEWAGGVYTRGLKVSLDLAEVTL